MKKTPNSDDEFFAEALRVAGGPPAKCAYVRWRVVSLTMRGTCVRQGALCSGNVKKEMK